MRCRYALVLMLYQWTLVLLRCRWGTGPNAISMGTRPNDAISMGTLVRAAVHGGRGEVRRPSDQTTAAQELGQPCARCMV